MSCRARILAAPHRRPGSPASGRSLTALLEVGLDELLGVLLQDGIDLVDDLVHLVLEVLALRAGVGLFGLLACLFALLDPALLLLLWHSGQLLTSSRARTQTF